MWKLMKVIIVAVPGLGKSTIMELVQKEIPDVKTVVYGDLMFELAKLEDGVKDRDQLRTAFSMERQMRLQERAAKKIGKMTGTVLVDTHASIKTTYGYWPGLPAKVIRNIDPSFIVLIEVDPKQIYEQRKADKKLKRSKVTKVGTVRKPRPLREAETPETIELQQQLNRTFAISAAYEIGCPLTVIDLRFPEKEKFEHSKTAAAEIVKLLK